MAWVVVASGCSFTFGSPPVATSRYKSAGWDTGIAIGSAVADAKAAGHSGAPDYVSANCYAAAGKVIAAVLLLEILVASKVSGKDGAVVGAVAVGFGSVLPNCSAEVGFSPAAGAAK